MVVAILITVMISIVVGINLIPLVNQKAIDITTGGEIPEGSAMLKLLDILPYIFIVVVILGAIAWIRGESNSISIPLFRRGTSKSDVNRFTEMADRLDVSTKQLEGIVGVKIEQVTGTTVDPMQYFRDRKIVTVSSEFQWFVVEKHPKYPMYKVVGLHPSNRNLNCAYLFGIDSHTKDPYLLRVPNTYLHRSVEDCARWCVGISGFDTLVEV